VHFLDWLFPTQNVTFSTHYSVETAVERLRGTVTKPYPFGWLLAGFSPCDVALGTVDAKAVRLQRVGRAYDISPKPVFRGAFRQGADGVELAGSFAASAIAKASALVWLGFVALWTLLSLLFLPTAPRQPSILLFPFVGALFFAGGVGFIKLCWRMSARDMEFLRSTIAEALRAR
jgi:hypothetical protein